MSSTEASLPVEERVTTLLRELMREGTSPDKSVRELGRDTGDKHDHVLRGIAFALDELVCNDLRARNLVQAKFDSVEDLHSEASQVLAVALSVTGDDKVVEVLKYTMFSNKLPLLRQMAIITVGGNNLVQCIPELISLLKDPYRAVTGGRLDFQVRRAACIALKSLGVTCKFIGPEDKAEETFEVSVDRASAVKAIARKIYSTSDSEAIGALRAIGRLGGDEARNALTQYLDVMRMRGNKGDHERLAKEVLSTIK